ncbi:hypothetical protein, partial [Aliivibrio salmonicida]|uniref:hypothetical protein n=1 Tax=Aliivibrio salmonicida TaxID=40269 RepID=UPI003D0CA4E1
MIKQKNKILIITILLISSTLFLLPVINGTRCNTSFYYDIEDYNISGNCKYGFFNAYVFPKNKDINQSSYLHISAIYMKFSTNSAIYIYNFDDYNMIHNKKNVRFLNSLKSNNYYQYHTT